MKRTAIVLIMGMSLSLSAFALGTLTNVNDFIENEWEDLYSPAYISQYIYDAHADNDEDGWSNWAEARYSATYNNSDPDNGEEYPIPTIAMTLRYSGSQSGSNLIINAYTTSGMDGPPDAVYSLSATNTWPVMLSLGQAANGWIREGDNYFFAFLDLDSSGTWNAGEPCGLPDNFATDIGWDDNSLDIEFTDYREGYFRFDLSTYQRSKDVILGLGDDNSSGDVSASSVQRVRVHRTIGSTSKTVFDREITDRTYIHEGDLFANGELALDWNLAADGSNSVVVYSVYVGDENNLFDNTLVSTFTNVYAEDTATPLQEPAVSMEPINGGYVYASRPIFRWTMPDLYPAFAIEVRKTSSIGPVVYESGPVAAPSRNVITDEYSYEAPIHAGNKLPSGHTFSVDTVYSWRVTTLNSKYSMDIPGGSDGTGYSDAGWSQWRDFYLAANTNTLTAATGYGMINATVKYYGIALDDLVDHVKVEAYTSRDFTGVAESQYTLTNAELLTMVSTNAATTTTNAVLCGLTPSKFVGNYYVMAYIDSNNNNERDNWESWGYANYYGTNILINSNDQSASTSAFRGLFGRVNAPYTVRPVTVVAASNQTSRVDIFIKDADTDNDRYPDAWEYQENPGEDFLSTLGP